VTPRYVTICNPDGKRWQAYAHALEAFWAARGARPEVAVVSWREVIPRRGDLEGLTAFDAPALVRLESPGRDFEVTKLLLAAGGYAEAAALPYQKGRLIRPGLQHQGFCAVLAGLRRALDARPHLTALACPLAVAELFDKNATSARLAAAGVPCPPSLLPLARSAGAPMRASDVLAAIRAQRWPVAYVKLAMGSSATGCAAVHALAEPPWALTTLLRRGGECFSTRQLQRVRGDDLTAALEFILAEGACIQRGIPLAQLDGQNFDVRVIVVHGTPAFTIFRLSAAPMTNLHLGGRRGDGAACRRAIPTRAWLDALDHCVEAARLYPCAMVGVDLAFERGCWQHFILEMNAFGDWFPEVTDDRGRTVHAVEIEMTAQRWGLG